MPSARAIGARVGLSGCYRAGASALVCGRGPVGRIDVLASRVPPSPLCVHPSWDGSFTVAQTPAFRMGYRTTTFLRAVRTTKFALRLFTRLAELAGSGWRW